MMGAEIGMLVVETIAKIRRAYFVQGKPIKAICRDLNLSRKVVRKVIRSKATEFRYERESQPLPKIGPWKDELDRLLSANEGKAARELLTLIRIFEELRDRGYPKGRLIRLPQTPRRNRSMFRDDVGVARDFSPACPGSLPHGGKT